MRISTRHSTFRVSAGLFAIVLAGSVLAQLSPENAVPCQEGSTVDVAYGDHTIDCEIGHTADLDWFTFQGDVGDGVRIVFRGFDAVLELRDPFNHPLPDGGQGENFWILPETGLYQLRVFDGQFEYTGPYRLQLERTWPLSWGVGLSHDDLPWSDSVDPDTDTDWLTFKGRSGTEVRLIVVGRNGAGFDPSIELLSPGGFSLGSANCDGGGSPCSFYEDFTLTEDGDHFVQFHDQSFAYSGDYEISLQCLFGSCPLGYYIRSVGFASSIEMNWDPTSDLDATYDVVKGDLSVLLESGGNFSLAVTECISSGNILAFIHPLDDPDPGEGFFYVVRAVQDQVGAGSYDTGRASQASRYGGRDLGPLSVNQSAYACTDLPPVPVFVPETPPGDIHMAAGAVEDSTFDVEIRVTDIDDFYGAAFHVSFDPTSVEFASFDATGSILSGQGSGTIFNAAPIVPGELAVVASILGQAAGIPSATGLLLTLRFNVTAATESNPFTFEPEASRQVTVCPTAGGVCDDVAGSLVWTGGALTAP